MYGGGGGGSGHPTTGFGAGAQGIIVVNYTVLNTTSSATVFMVTFDAWMKKVTGLGSDEPPTSGGVALVAVLIIVLARIFMKVVRRNAAPTRQAQGAVLDWQFERI